VATLTMGLVSPIHTALFPRLSQLVVKKDEAGISNLYHRGCQLASIIILPISITMIFFSKEILSTWIGDPTVVNNTHMLLSLLIVGTTIKAYMTLPYTLQLAHGWTKLAFYKNVVAVIIIVPSMLWAVQMYQGIGAAWVLIFLYLGLLIFEIIIMHKRILKGNIRKRYDYDVLIPILIVSIIGLAAHEIHDMFPIDVSAVITALVVLCTLLFSFIASAWATGNLNVRVMSLLKIKERKKIV
jgi:O-antigen/teichoic acid export membrane protein